MKEPLLYLWPKFGCHRNSSFQRRPIWWKTYLNSNSPSTLLDLVICYRCCISDFAICPVVGLRHGNANSIQNASSVTNPTMELFCIRLSFTLPCCATWQIANSLLNFIVHKSSYCKCSRPIACQVRTTLIYSLNNPLQMRESHSNMQVLTEIN